MMTIAQAFEITYQKVMKARIVRKGRQDGGERRSKHLWLCIFMKCSILKFIHRLLLHSI